MELGPIAHVVKLGQFHGDADAYYVRSDKFNKPMLWTLPNGSVAEGMTADGILSSEDSDNRNLPIHDMKVYSLDGHPFPEGLVTVPCNRGGAGNGNSNSNSRVLIACDSNWFTYRI